MQRPKLMPTSCDSKNHTFILIIIFIIILDCVLLQENLCNASAMPKIHYHHQKNQNHHSSSFLSFIFSSFQKRPNHFRRKKTSSVTKKSKLSIAESLGCDSGLSRSDFTHMDNICHRCFKLFREIEIYNTCRFD